MSSFIEVKPKIKFSREWAMLNKNTFTIKPIKELLNRYPEVKSKNCIDPFANESKMAAITNDLNIKYNTNYHLDAIDFLKLFDNNSVDCVLFDPPYSLRQLEECYEGIGKSLTQNETQRFWFDCKDQIARITHKDSIVISFGWDTNGIGLKNGFDIIEILIVAHGGHHHDTLVVVEKKRY